MKNKLILTAIGMIAGMLMCASSALANAVAVSNVVLQNKNLGLGTVEVKFDLAQANTFSGTDANNQAFYDRVWVFVKYWVQGVDSATSGWHHATLVSGGTITPTSDGKGAFCQVGVNQVLKWSYATDGVTGTSTIKVRVNAIEAAYIPTGSFVYNAGGIGGLTFNNYGAGSQANVTGAVTATGDGTDTTHGPSGCAIGWPNGYNAFYIAKYEVSQGQYADYLNMLDATNATNRYYTGVDYRYSITYTSGNAYGSRYAAGSPSRAMNQTSWDDVRAYASWCGMRPATEMEFEKAGRGAGISNTSTYPWGSTDPSATTYTFDGATFSQYYACYNNSSGGPVDVGHYLSGDIARSNAQTGASLYGVTDLAGNNWEHLINCAWTQVPANGNGTVTWPASWPDAAAGKGIRGGDWADGSSYLRVSGRNGAGGTYTTRNVDFGVRLCRTSP